MSSFVLRVGKVLDPAHAEASAGYVSEGDVIGGADEVTGPHQHEPGGIDGTVYLSDGDLAEVPPAAGVLEEVVPLGDHPALEALARGAVAHRRRVAVGPVVLLQGFG
jgi:hypothetical protein